jgi:hypothetical protein
MILCRRYRSTLAALAAVFQLAVTGGAVADGWLEARGEKALGAHVEAQDGINHAPLHDHESCAVCQHLNSFGSSLLSNSAQFNTLTEQYSVLPRDAQLPRGIYHNNQSLPRAPPV